MRNIFLLYMPPGNAEAMVHYQDTIRIRSRSIGLRRTSLPVSDKLQQVFGSRPIAVWGSRDTSANRAKFDRMDEGDEILILEGHTIRLLGRVAAKDVNPHLSRELWQNLRGGETEGWDLIYFIANPREIDLPFQTFCELLGYQPDFHLHGFTRVAEKRLETFLQSV